MNVRTDDESLATLCRRAVSEIGNLVRLEVADARREVSARTKRLGMAAGALAVAAVFALFAIVAATAGAILALGMVVAPWLAAAIVAVAYVLIAAVAALVGRSLLRQGLPPVPSTSLRHMKEDFRWIIKRVTSAKA